MWFAAGAMANALLPINARLNRIDGRLDGMDHRIIIAEARAFSSSTHRFSDVLVAPIIPPTVAAPAGFPDTIIQELGELSMANCNKQ